MHTPRSEEHGCTAQSQPDDGQAAPHDTPAQHTHHGPTVAVMHTQLVPRSSGAVTQQPDDGQAAPHAKLRCPGHRRNRGYRQNKTVKSTRCISPRVVILHATRVGPQLALHSKTTRMRAQVDPHAC
jgi:hypothetical protein